MTDLMESLFTYAQEKLIRSLLNQESEYIPACHNADRQEEILRALLGKDAETHLDKLIREQELLLFMQERAMFRAGFQIAMGLAAGA